jgi:non-canonical (house-cleaning) NTP pyrophosphatase
MIAPIRPIVVAVASMRPPKLEGVRQAFADFSARSVNRSAAQSAALSVESQTFEVVGADVPSGVRHTPLSREEMMTGARQRAEALLQLPRAKQERWTYFVGLEGGLDIIQLPAHGPDQPARLRPGQRLGERPTQRLVLLENWAYICDAGGNGAYGQSGAVALPTELATRVVDDGVELAEAIDAFADSKGVRDGPGAWGVLTGNLVTRQDAIRLSVINALSALFRELHFGTGPTIRGR